MGDLTCQSNCKVGDKREYNDLLNRLLGVCCRRCGQEWLLKQFVNEEILASSEKVTYEKKKENVTLYKTFYNNGKCKTCKTKDTAFQIQPTTYVNEKNADVIMTLQVGDHIEWKRPYDTNHHAVVVDINEENKNLVTIAQLAMNMKTKDKGNSKTIIFEEKMDLREEKDKIVRINYAKAVTERNPVELVRARAYSSIGDAGYNLILNNCESFATYCKTGVAQSHKVREYKDSNHGLLGIYCRLCEQEWLLEHFLYEEQLLSSEKVTYEKNEENITVHQTFYKVNKCKIIETKLPVDTAFQIQSTRDVYEKDEDLIKTLKVGDHIAWKLSTTIYHHAIVVDIDKENKNLITVVHWTSVKENGGKSKSKATIIEEKMDLRAKKDKIARINYAEDVTEKNPVEIVRARAYSRIGDTGYDLFNDNCESFATYCKTGVAQSHQVHWLNAKLKDLVMSIPGYLLKLAEGVTWKSVVSMLGRFVGPESAEIISKSFEKFPIGPPLVAAAVILAFEVYYWRRDRKQLYEKYQSHDITSGDCQRLVLERAIEFLFTAGFAVAGSFIPGFICGIIGGYAGMIFGKFVGKAVANFITESYMRKWVAIPEL